MKTGRYAFLGLSLALALILSYVETLIPFGFAIPGIKLGLANLIVLIFLSLKRTKEAILISVTRILLAGFMFGSLSTILYALCGGLLSFIVMYLVLKIDKVSVRLVSMTGGLFHNIGQLIVAGFIVGFKSIIYYIPYLVLAGLLTGLLIGVICSLVLPYIRKHIIGFGDLK